MLRTLVVLIVAALASAGLSACSINMPMVDALSANGDDEKAPQLASQTTQTTEDSGISGRLKRLWERMTTDKKRVTKVGRIDRAPQFNTAQATRLVNRYRTAHGLKPLKVSQKLNEAAQRQARDLAENDRISHYGSDGSDPWDRVRKTGFKPRLAAENVGTGQASFAEVLDGWKHSPGHNRNLLLADATEIGFGMAYRPNTEFKTFWTLVVGAPE